MKIASAINKSVMTAAVAASVAGFVASAYASAPTPYKGDMSGKEKCYGVAKAGHNDCAGGGASCGGSASQDGQGFVAVPKGLCEKLANGSLSDPSKN